MPGSGWPRRPFGGSGCSGVSRVPRTPRRSPAPGRRTRRPLDPARLVRALDRLAAIAPPPEPPPELLARIDHHHRACRDHPRGASRRADRRPPGPPRRGSRPGRHRDHVPGDARTHEAPRDRRRAGRAVGADRRPRRPRRRNVQPPGWSVARRRAARRDPGVVRMTAEARRADAPSVATSDAPSRRRRPGDRTPPPIELTEAALEALLFVAERRSRGARSRPWPARTATRSMPGWATWRSRCASGHPARRSMATAWSWPPRPMAARSSLATSAPTPSACRPPRSRPSRSSPTASR